MVERSESEKCPTCGTTRITFNPPLYFEVGESCGATAFMKIMINDHWHSSQPISCLNFKGHENSEKISERSHYYLVEDTVSWLEPKR